MARAGWCSACGAYVYLSPTGGCPFGHGQEHISNHYEAPDPPVAPPASAAGTLDDLIAEAARLADEHVVVERYGEGVVIQSDSMSSEHIVEVLDRALALKPGDIDLMLARSDMLALGMQFKTAEDVIDEILARDPENFEARVRKDHWGEWSNVFTLPHWSEHATQLVPSMEQDLAQARSVQMVRLGVKPVPSIVRGVQSGEMAPGLGSSTRALWEPVWSDTAAGAIVAHYLMVEDDPANPYRAEAFLPIEKPQKAFRMNGYWLVRQLADADGVFVILAEGSRVIFNRWYAFPSSVRAHLHAIANHLDSARAATGQDGFRQAMQWHMNNFDMDQITFDLPLSDHAAGVSGFASPS